MVEERKQYVPEVPMTTKEDAVQVLDELSLKVFSKLKGRILATIEQTLPIEDSRLIPLKNAVAGHILFVTKYMKEKIAQAVKLLQEG